MAVHLRLRRMGAKKKPIYGLVAADSRFPRDGRYIEKIGNYYPLLAKTDENRFVLKKERAEYWLSQGAQPTDRVARLLHTQGLMDKPKTPTPSKKHLPKAKAQQRAEEKKKIAEDAKKAADAPSDAAKE
ncbi:MAG: 30S ribosomal protein S16 [Alphaproteobacteria bacterium]|nr:30S ribosomal protein S16 [Alphaproteobacteria bacterium]